MAQQNDSSRIEKWLLIIISLLKKKPSKNIAKKDLDMQFPQDQEADIDFDISYCKNILENFMFNCLIFTV